MRTRQAVLTILGQRDGRDALMRVLVIALAVFPLCLS